MPDELLNYLGDRFINNGIKAYTGASFMEYLQVPEFYDEVAFHKKCGGKVEVQGDKLVFTGVSHAIH